MGRESLIGNDVVLFTTRYCGYCQAAKRFLRDAKHAAFREIDVTEDDATRDWLVERTGMITVPQIFVGGEHVGGYDDLRALDKAGGLDALLDRAA